MLLLLILADAFTGALDTGVQFAACGIPTRVVVGEQVDFAANDAAVLVWAALQRWELAPTSSPDLWRCIIWMLAGSPVT